MVMVLHTPNVIEFVHIRFDSFFFDEKEKKNLTKKKNSLKEFDCMQRQV